MTKALTGSYRIGQMAWLYAVRLPWSGIRCRIPFTTTKAFEKHHWMLQCKECSIKHRLRYFETIVLPQLASLQSTRRYTENTCTNMAFNSENLFVALWRNGMLCCVNGKCVWITMLVPVEFPPGQRSVWFNTGPSVITLQIYLPIAGWADHFCKIHVQPISPVDAHNQFGTLDRICFASARL